MAKSPSFTKREKEKKRLAKQSAKQKQKEQRKLSKQPKSFEDMIAYIDENGVIVSSLPEKGEESIGAKTELGIISIVK